MISKTVIVVLTVAAFFYAMCLVLFRRRLPDPKRSAGLRRRFILATLLFVGLLGAMSVKGGKLAIKAIPDWGWNPAMCYSVQVRIDHPATINELIGTLKAVWRTLDPKQSENFRIRLEAAAGSGVIRKKTADMLATAFSELAYHKKRTRSDGLKMTCYDMTQLGGTLYTTRENALKQLELLEDARKSGKIGEETAGKAQAVLAREVEMLYRAKGIWSKDWRIQNRLIQEYKNGEIAAGDVASVAAGIIVEMEEGQAPDLTPAKRLAVMQNRVEELLAGEKFHGGGGPVGNDWMDPGIRPNVSTILVKTGLIGNRIMVSCYERMAGPVKARSEELKKLQQQLLDKNVEAGVLDVEVAEKAAVATDETRIDYATEADIRNYQKKIRRIMRMLYKRGELPSSFVEKIEGAVDIEIISFDSAKGLRNDVGWHLRSLSWMAVGEEVMKRLEKRKLITTARNHRRVMDWSWRNRPSLSDDVKRQLAEFETLLDSREHLRLDGDDKIITGKHQMPQTDTEYRLKIRRVCRALVKAGLVKQNQLKSIEDIIGIPIFGVLEKR